MKKILVLITAIFLLASCNAQNSTVSSYKSTLLNISFDYPADWQMNEDETNKSIEIHSPETEDAGTNIIVTIPAESFDEYEKTYKDNIQSNKMSVKETNVTTKNNDYSARDYGQEGWLYSLIQVNEHFIGVGSERYLNQEQKEGLDIILDSLSF